VESCPRVDYADWIHTWTFQRWNAKSTHGDSRRPHRGRNRCWTGNYASFDAAVAAYAEESNSDSFSVDTGNPSIPESPAAITDPGQFAGMVIARIIPEPSSAALLGFGAAALFLFRRHK
jgi:hypothetical protein